MFDVFGKLRLVPGRMKTAFEGRSFNATIQTDLQLACLFCKQILVLGVSQHDLMTSDELYAAMDGLHAIELHARRRSSVDRNEGHLFNHRSDCVGC